MADLGQLQGGVNVTGYNTKALNLGQDAPAALPPNTSKLSQAQGHAALMGTVAKTLSELPSLLLSSYVGGKKVGTQLQANSVLSGVLSGKTPSLPEGTTVTPEGVKYAAPDPDAATLTEQKTRLGEANIAHVNAQTKALQEHPPGGLEENPLAAAFGAPATNDNESAIGTATSYGYAGDHYGGPKATASTTGPMGNKLDADSLAVSPDVEKMLTAKGYKFGDMVTLKTAGGETVTRRWDDRTAQHDSTGQWSVDDKGRQIIGENGKPLPALTGRFDFHAGPDGKPSKYNGVKITGVVPPSATGALAATEPPLPTGGANGALAGGDTPALAADGMPVALDATPAPATSAVTPDGAINPEAAIAATGGVKVTDQGHAGGVVTRYPGFDKEETDDGTVYVYPHKIKPGQKPFSVFKKPVNYHADTVKMISASGYQPKPGETEASVTANARAALTEAEKVSPDVRPVFMRWGSSLQSNPVVKEFYTARHQKDVVDSALAGGKLTPAVALGVIDSFVKAMRGGAATQGMTRILEEAQPMRSRLELMYKRITGTPDENAVLTKDMADDVQAILKKIEENARHEVEAMKDGDKEYLSTIGVPAGAVEKTYKRILTGVKTSVNPEALATEGAPASNSKDAAALQWLQANPSDPKAAGVKASLQAKGIAVK